MTSTDIHSKRNFGLDLMRALAITGVFLAHGVTIFESLGVGVDLFFVLSGFLIGRIYFRLHKAGDFRLGSFWIARWWRTLPPYLAALAIFAIAERWIPGNPIEWYYIFFLQTVLGLKGFGPSWSLCVEEHFYLALPLLAMLVQAIFGAKVFRWILPAAFFLPTLLRVASFALVGGVGKMPDQWYRLTPYHCDGLIAGVYLAYLFVEQPELFRRARGLAILCTPLVPISVIAAFFFAGRELFEALYMTGLALGFAGWLRLAQDISWKPVSFAGRVVEKMVRGIALASYSIYLVHVLVMGDLHFLLADWRRGVAKTFVILSGALIFGIGFYFAFERPSIWTRNWFLARRKAPEMSLSHQ